MSRKEAAATNNWSMANSNLLASKPTVAVATMRRQQLVFYAVALSVVAVLILTVYNGRNVSVYGDFKIIVISRPMLNKTVLPTPAAAAAAAAAVFTKIVHQSWKTRQLPTDRARRWSASWKTCFPNWEWRLWTDEDNLALVRDHYAWFLPVYKGHVQPVERADLARYFYMYHYGGIYTDLDTVCIRNFTSLLGSAPLIFGGMDNDHNDGVLHSLVQNSFMASQRPGHQFWMRLIKRIERNFKAGKRGRPEDLTGPNVLMEELRDLVRSNSTDAMIFPGKYFNPFSWKLNRNPACKDFGRMLETDEKACIASFPEAYVVQLHTQSWGRGHMR